MVRCSGQVENGSGSRKYKVKNVTISCWSVDKLVQANIIN